MVDEIALPEPVLDELVGGGGIGYAQQRFGQHHQRQALLGGQREFAQQRFDAAKAIAPGANRLDQVRGGAVDPALLIRWQARGFEQAGGEPAVVRRVRRCERRNIR